MEVLALFGPTAVGKTAVAIALAARLRARGEDPVAISADAIQVYRGLETLAGTATAEQQKQLETRLVSIAGLDETFSAGRYAALAHAEIDRLLEQQRQPIVVGGTGLYLRAALCDLDLGSPPPAGLRASLEAEYDSDAGRSLLARLAQFDPSIAAIEPADRKRVVRAAELAAVGRKIERGDASSLWTAGTRRPTRLFGLIAEREYLYDQIDRRVDAIVAAGAADEVRRAEAAGASATARKALGYDELLTGDIGAIKARTRRYAKRQLTWMRKLAAIELIDVTEMTAAQTAAAIDAAAFNR